MEKIIELKDLKLKRAGNSYCFIIGKSVVEQAGLFELGKTYKAKFESAGMVFSTHGFYNYLVPMAIT